MSTFPARKPYTVRDYLAATGGPMEVIHGEVYGMTPAPSAKHQTVVVNLVSEIRSALRAGDAERKNPCRAYVAPFDVVLDDLTVVQPDVCIVCDPAQIQDGLCVGAPRFIAEVLSPSTARKDRQDKLRLYELHRVPQYLIIDPVDGWNQLYTLGSEGVFDAGRALPMDEPVEVAGLTLAATLRELVEPE
jgi:Uma2 family endonuclease